MVYVNQIRRHFGTNEPGNESVESVGGREREKRRFFPFSLLDTRGAPSSSFLTSVFPEISKAFSPLFPFIPPPLFSYPVLRRSRPPSHPLYPVSALLSRLHPFQYLQTITHSCSRGTVINHSLDAAETMVRCISRPRVYSCATSVVQ